MTETTNTESALALAYTISHDLITAAKASDGVRYGLIEMMEGRIKHDILTAIHGPK